MIVDVQRVQRELESAWVRQVGQLTTDADNHTLTSFSHRCAHEMITRWRQLDQLLLMKYIDGNIKTVEDGRIKTTPTGVVTGIKQPPYPAWFYRQIVNDKGEVLRVK